MVTPVLELDPAFEITQSYRSATWQNSLGDGYRSLSPKGYLIPETWEVSRTGLSNSEVTALLGNLKAFTGVQGFLWRPSEDEDYKIYTCDNWDSTLLAPNLWRINATFNLDLTAECTQFAQLIPDAQILSMLTEALGFIQRFTTTSYPSLVSSNGLIREDFRGSLENSFRYLPATSSTAENQAKAVIACVEAYRLTNTETWRTLAINLADNLITYFFNQPLPQNITSAWFPHWLVNTRSGLQTEGQKAENPINNGHFAVFVDFNNGTAVIPSGQRGLFLSRVIRVYGQNSGGFNIWKSINSPVLGTIELDIDYWVSDFNLSGEAYRIYPRSKRLKPVVTSEQVGTIKLNSNITDILRVDYLTYNEELLGLNQKYEIFTGIRALEPNEINVEFASLFACYNAFKGLAEITNSSYWQQAQNTIRQNTLNLLNISNPSFIYKKSNNEDPYSYPGIQTNRDFGGSFSTYRVTTGVFRDFLGVEVLETTSTISQTWIYNAASILDMTEDSLISIEIGCTEAVVLEILLHESDFSVLPNYTAFILINEPEEIYNLSFEPSDFISWSDLNIVWHPSYYDAVIVSSGTVTLNQGVDKYLYSTITGSLNSLLEFNIKTPDKLLNPPRICYRFSGVAILRIRDSLGVYWDTPLPQYADFTEKLFNWSEFFYSTVNSTQPQPPETIPDTENRITEIKIIFQANSELSVKWMTVGDPLINLETPLRLYRPSLISRDRRYHSIFLGDFRCDNNEAEALGYYPGVTPFKIDTTNGIVTGFSGIPTVKSQDSSFWESLGRTEELNNVLSFLDAAQNHYTNQSINKRVGAFTPSYTWPIWANGELFTQSAITWSLNTFSWNAYYPDPSLGSSQYKALLGIAKTYFETQNETARGILENFLRFIDRSMSFNKRLPNLFNPIIDPQKTENNIQNSALVLKAALYANVAGFNSEVTFRIIKKCFENISENYISSGVMRGSFANSQITFNLSATDYKEYYGAWHFEVVEALSLLLRFKQGNLITYPSCYVNLDILEEQFRYSCINGTCIADPLGVFGSLAECQAACGEIKKYKCDYGSIVEDPNGEFTLQEAELFCTPDCVAGLSLKRFTYTIRLANTETGQEQSVSRTILAESLYDYYDTFDDGGSSLSVELLGYVRVCFPDDIEGEFCFCDFAADIGSTPLGGINWIIISRSFTIEEL